MGESATLCSISTNTGESLKPFTAPVMLIRPTNRMPKPIQISPTTLLRLDLTNMIRMIPISSAMGASVSVSNSHRTRLSPSPPPIKARLVIQAVIVVPMLAPITIETACFRVNAPAPSNATARTMVAVELWITAVTKVPVKTPMITLLVSLPSTRFSAAPELFFRPSPMTSIP